MALSMKYAAANEAVRPEEEEIPPEILAVIAAAAAVFLGTQFPHYVQLELLHPHHESVEPMDAAGTSIRSGLA